MKHKDIVTNSTTEGDVEFSGLINDQTRYLLEVIFFTGFTGSISFLGTIANIINIVVFCKQGFSDSVNISFLALAISDVGSLVTLVWQGVCFNPYFHKADIPFESRDVQYLTAGWPHVCFARITSWITAFITFERCLCISVPLKVKLIITSKRTLYINAGIFLTMFASVSPVYYAINIGPKFFPGRNETLLGLVYKPDGADIENVSFSINVFAQLSSVLFVIICTCVLIHNLVLKSKWRKSTQSSAATARSAASGSGESGMSSKEKRVVKLVTLISCIFIACFLPSAVNLILMISSDDYSIVGKYRNMFQVSWSMLNTLEATNCSVNICVYYTMSSKYRAVFTSLFAKKNKN
ncbi:neuropeptides capa receptor-like [Aplysia californica]|uniref:Neuropeptides capa receptor-like n=1 Tax=Aplysia californica TaxID=6500 RepID=A0ABM0JG08_APLCA|nr:neuropeptides capa receptor-like [Aplysia californica]